MWRAGTQDHAARPVPALGGGGGAVIGGNARRDLTDLTPFARAAKHLVWARGASLDGPQGVSVRVCACPHASSAGATAGALRHATVRHDVQFRPVRDTDDSTRQDGRCYTRPQCTVSCPVPSPSSPAHTTHAPPPPHTRKGEMPPVRGKKPLRKAFTLPTALQFRGDVPRGASDGGVGGAAGRAGRHIDRTPVHRRARTHAARAAPPGSRGGRKINRKFIRLIKSSPRLVRGAHAQPARPRYRR